MRLLRTMIFALAVLMTGTAVAQKGKKDFANMKVAKPGTMEYETQRQSAVIALDSLIWIVGNPDRRKQVFGKSTTIHADQLLKFVDEVCEKFNNDPVLMDSVASAFFVSNDVYGERRFYELKKLWPNFVDAYYTHASLYHQLAWLENPKYNPDFLRKSKEQIDSAKIVIDRLIKEKQIEPKQIVAKSAEPYMNWVYMQGKYAPQTIGEELEALKAKHPRYPGYLKAARYFDRESARDGSLILSARECYGKAERDSMMAQDFINYAIICYMIGNRQKKQSDYEEGIQAASEGFKKYPTNYQLLRQKLYNQGGQTTAYGLSSSEKKQMWPKLYEVAMAFVQVPDSFERQFLDYKWIAKGNMETAHYAEAIDFYNRELMMSFSDSLERSSAMLGIVDCYNSMKDYEKALIAFYDYEDYKRRKKLAMEVNDYIKAGRSYEGLAADTSLLAPTRSLYYEKADSMYKVGGDVSPLNLLLMTRLRWSNAFKYAQLLHNDPKNVNGFVAMPVLVDASVRLTKVAQAQLDSLKSLAPDQIESRDKYDASIAEAYFRIQQGYYWLMEGVVYSDDKNSREPAFKYSEIILDLPGTYDIDGMESDMFPKYEQYRNRAKEIYNKFYPLFGKGKKKRTDI